MSDAIQDDSIPLTTPGAYAVPGINASVQVLEELVGALHRITAQLDLLLGGGHSSGATDPPAVCEFAAQVGVEPADVYLALWCVVLQRLSGETSLSVDVQVSATDRVSATIDFTPTDQIGELALRARAAVLAGVRHAAGSPSSAPSATYGFAHGQLALPGADLQLRADGDFTVVGEPGVSAGAVQALRHLVGQLGTPSAKATPVVQLGLVGEADEHALQNLGKGPVQTDVATLATVFERVFSQFPDRIAVRYRGVDTSYADLDRRSRAVGALLRDAGVRPGDVVGVILPASTDQVATMLGIKRIGGAWLPMEAGDPVARIATVIKAADPVKVVCSRELADALELGERALVLEDTDGLQGDSGPFVSGAGDELAYVIFTSGSTGQPKGVRLTNAALENFIAGMPTALSWGSGARVGCLTATSFDIYILETWMSLATASTVVIAGDDEARTPGEIADFLTANRVTHAQMTPSRLRLLHADAEAADQALAGLDTLLVGGEAFPEELLVNLRRHPGLALYNVYGPTETCIWSSVKHLEQGSDVSLGTPLLNTTIYVLDEDLRMVPEGFPGDIWIGGRGVSPGYLNRPDLNQSVFLTSPHGGEPMYRTGDRGVWRDGELHYLGRVDNQVKIRGFRMELEEIEHVITHHEDVVDAAVIVDQVSRGNQLLRGFYQTRPGVSVAPRDLKDFLTGLLPGPMVPATLVAVPSIPMTTSGKVDRNAVRTRAENLDAWTASDDAPEPSASLSPLVLAAWRKVLGNVPISVTDSFFDLGGNSLNVIMLREELNRVLPGMVEVTELFAHATFGHLLDHLERRFIARAESVADAAGVTLPKAWFASSRAGSGSTQIEATIPAAVRERLGALAGGGESRQAALAAIHVAFAVTLHKLLAAEAITFWLSGPDGRVWPTRIDFAAQGDFPTVLNVHLAALARGDDIAPGQVSLTVDDGAVTIACLVGPYDGVDDALRAFDIVIGVDQPSDPHTVIVRYARRLTTLSMERLLASAMKLLGVLVLRSAIS